MKINLFYVLMAGILMSGVIFVWPKNKPSLVVTDSVPTPPPASVITAATSPLPAPTELTGHAELPHTIYLSWNAVTDETVTRYRVVRNDLLIAEVSEPRFADASVITDRAYGYYVQAIDGQGRFSQPSNFILVTVTRPVATTTSPTITPSTKNKNTSTANKNTTTTRPQNTNVITNTSTPINTNTTPTTSQDYVVTVTENGEFSPLTLTIHPTDTVTFTYISGEGDEVELNFSPSIGTSVKLDHERTTKTVTIESLGTYTFQKREESEQVGTITVTAP